MNEKSLGSQQPRRSFPFGPADSSLSQHMLP